MKKEIYICGAGGHGISVYELITSLGQYDVKGFLDDTLPIGTEVVDDICVSDTFLPSDEFKSSNSKIIAIGIADYTSLFKRRELMIQLEKRDFIFPKLIHSSALIGKNVEIGEGVQIHAGAIIRANSKIGNWSVINTGSIVEHGTVIGVNNSISPGSVLCGNVQTGDSVFLGANSTVLPGLHVGSRVVVGAGSVVTRELSSDSVYSGIPAKKLN